MVPKYWIGERIRLMRVMKGLTQGHIITEAGISQGYLSKIEKGSRDPGFHLVLRIARSLGCSLQELAEGNGPLQQVRLRVVAKGERKSRARAS